MRLRTLPLLCLLTLSPWCANTAAANGSDCPAAFRSYSTQTVLLDLLLNPVTRSIIERELPGVLGKLPPELLRETPPTFAAILSLRMLLGFGGGAPSAAELTRIDAQLAAVQVTHAAATARCARYDEATAPLPRTIPRPAALVFDKINGFRDVPSVDAARVALEGIGQRNGITLVFSDNGAVFNAQDLRRFDAVIWNNVSGDVLTNPQRAAFRHYIEQGGGFAAMHGSGGDPVYDWDWYVDTLIGARFKGHPQSPQFQAATVITEQPGSDIVRGLPPRWTLTEEWYSFESSPRAHGARVLAAVDERSYQLVSEQATYGPRDLRMGDHPIAWTKCIGNGRSFYTAIGHRPESYTDPNALLLLERGVLWAAAKGTTRCRQDNEVER